MLSGPLQCQRCGATELPINFGKRFWRTPQSCDPAWKNELCSAIGDGRMVERQHLEGLLMFRCKLRKVCEKLAWRVPKSDLERLLPRKEVAWEEVLVFQIALGLPWKLKWTSACLRVCVCVFVHPWGKESQSSNIHVLATRCVPIEVEMLSKKPGNTCFNLP